MKRFYLAMFILLPLLLPYSTFARQGPPPPPPPSREYFPAQWDDYVSEKGRFRTKFPGKPKESVETDASIGKEMYVISHNGILEYGITYFDIPQAPDDLAERRKILKNLRANVLESAKNSEPQIIKEGESDVKGHPGYFFHLEMKNGVVRLKWVMVGKRLYVIVAGGRKGSPNELEGKDHFEKMATAFINSFDIIP
jgi:hypothetical protein